MELILLERVAKLGQMGQVVKVKNGYARNFLLPQGKALRATKANLERFENERAQLEARNLELKTEAEHVATNLEGKSFTAIRQAGDSGQLFGSVSTRDIVELMTAGGFTVGRNQVQLERPIKELGVYQVTVSLHPEVDTHIDVIVARTEEEAERIARGEDVTAQVDDEDEFALDVEEIFEEEALEAVGEAEEGSEESSAESAEDSSETGEEKS